MVMTVSFASPLCTWLVATTCMNEPSEKERISKSKSAEFARSSKKLSKTTRRIIFESKNGGSSSSSFSGYKIQSLMSFCPFKPCEEYNNSTGISSSFSLFGSKDVPMNHKQRRLSKSSRSGNNLFVT